MVFHDMIVDMINNKRFNPLVTELFIRGRKLNISIALITQSYFNPNRAGLSGSRTYLISI